MSHKNEKVHEKSLQQGVLLFEMIFMQCFNVLYFFSF